MKRFVAVALAIGLGSAGLAVQTAGAAPTATRAPIPGQRPPWATPAAEIAPTPDAETVPIRVYLKLRNQAGAEAQAAAVSDPTNPAYGHYLTPRQVRDAYAPTSAAVAQVSTWLASAGLGVGYVPSNRAYVSATGSAAQVEAAFGTSLAEYRVRGTDVRAPETDPTVPTDVGCAHRRCRRVSTRARASCNRPTSVVRTSAASANPASARPAVARR